MDEENIGNISTTEWNRLAKRLEHAVEYEDKCVADVLIKVAPGKEEEVYDALIDNEHIEYLRKVFGNSADLVATIYGNTPAHVGQIVVEDIRSRSGVIDTETLPEIKGL